MLVHTGRFAGRTFMKRIHALLVLTLVAASWILSLFAQAADIRLANGIRLHYETSGAGDIPAALVHG
jgi:fucose permease